MAATLSPKSPAPSLATSRSAGSRPGQLDDLQGILGHLVLLYIKAKNYHWNVHGPEFYGLHKTFDGVQEVALDWADRIGERMRSLQIPVDATAKRFLADACFPEGNMKLDATTMCNDLLKTVDCIVACTEDMIKANVPDTTTVNQLQELSYDLGKQSYFLRSSL